MTQCTKSKSKLWIALGVLLVLAMFIGVYNAAEADPLITITADSDSKMYDGQALTDDGYTVTGLPDGYTLTATTAGEITHYSATGVANEIKSYTIYDSERVDVTNSYINNVETIDGTLKITKRDVTLTSNDATKKYDGVPLTAETVTVSGSGFVDGEGADYYNFASQTAVGKTNNTFNYALKNGTSDDDYNITTEEGTLTVTQNDTLVTIFAASDSKMYDGASLTNFGYTYDGSLASGDYFYSVTVSGTITDAGTAANEVTNYVIKNHAGDDVTSFYSNIQKEDGTLEITKRDVTLTSGNAQEAYNGSPLKNDTITVSGDGFVGTEGASYDVTGSQTTVGTSKNTFTYTLNDSTKADNYDITTVEGSLTVTPAEFIITIDNEIVSGLEFKYDNTSVKVLGAAQYQVEGLQQGDKVENVTITTNSANAGTYDEDMYTLAYDIVNADGESVKSSYTIAEYKHDVDITKLNVKLKAGSAEKVYDSTELTCKEYTVAGVSDGIDGLLAGETVTKCYFTADSTITHAGSTANKIDDVEITKADGSDSSMNYNVFTDDGTLEVTPRPVWLISTSAEKYYDGTALQNRQVIVTGPSYRNPEADVDEEGFLDGDGCTYDFVNDNKVIDKDGNVVAWTVSEANGTAYGQTEVGTSKNEFNYNNFTSVYAGSLISDYDIIYGGNQVAKGILTDVVDMFGDLTVWGGPVEIVMNDYSWTYDYQAKTYGYFGDGYTVTVTLDEEGTEEETTSFEENSEGTAVDLCGKDTIVVTVTGEGGSVETGKVQHVGEDKQNSATYTIYRDGDDVTDEVEEYYQISIDGGLLKITPRFVEIVSGSAEKSYDGTALTERSVLDKGFISGEDAVYEVTGSQTEVGVSDNTFEISELITDTKATDYQITKTYGKLVVTTDAEITVTADSDSKMYDGTALTADGYTYTGTLVDGHTLSVTVEGTITDAGTVANEITECKVLDASGQDVTACYPNLVKVDGELTVTKRDVTLTSASDSKRFDDTELINEEVTVDGDGFAEGEGATFEVTGSQLEVGSSANTFTYTLDEGTKAENYNIVTEEGTLTVIEQFIDIDEDDYYYDAVNWATKEGVTSGTSETTFSPADFCTRAQIVTFLWRVAGCPEPETADCVFTDVAKDAYYYNAVLWAVENGITNGTTATTFSPDATCTRGQAVTFLYRYEGCPAVYATNVFTDVVAGAYYYNAVLWAIEWEITNGTSLTTFSPDALCTRAQIVTFLYRAFDFGVE